MARGVCNGKISECFSASMEMEMDSESSRRVLMMQKRLQDRLILTLEGVKSLLAAQGTSETSKHDEKGNLP
ncbi:hypothetical protein RJ641_004784 [Dillenia turbinata]|uniref:Uncharacterized protein n=1 Tax=Dillenia turbinata TaxID=194707 RepID=A0AAN8ZDA5_9MAGN